MITGKRVRQPGRNRWSGRRCRRRAQRHLGQRQLGRPGLQQWHQRQRRAGEPDWHRPDRDRESRQWVRWCQGRIRRRRQHDRRDRRGAGNVITDNGGPGVVLTGVGTVDDEIVGNRIFANSGQAIDLGGDGVTDNYSSPRQGPEQPPEFRRLSSKPAAGQFQGWLSGSTPDTLFHIELFASAELWTRRLGGSRRIPGLARCDH